MSESRLVTIAQIQGRVRGAGSEFVLACDMRFAARDAGLRVIQTPYRAPNANAYAERFVRSIKEECLSRLILFGERRHRRAVAEFIAHYHRERNHQGLGNELIDGEPAKARVARVCRHQRLGGLLNYYARAA